MLTTAAPPGPATETARTGVSGDRHVHRVAVLADETVAPLELAAAVHLFHSAGAHHGAVRYEVGVVSTVHHDGAAPRAVTTSVGPHRPASFAIVPEHSTTWASTADTVVVPGHAAYVDVVPGDVAVLIKDAARRRARLVALGLGTFALAAAGVLDARAATTHWRWVDDLAHRHPRIEVRREALYVDDGPVHTAAGAAAAIDLVLQLIEHDHGVTTAAVIANSVVAPPKRDGERVQYLDHTAPAEQDPIQAVMRWAEEHLADELSVADLARRAHMSTRHFARRFRATIGATPLDWLLRVRVRRAQFLLESTTWSVERVAHESGFGSPGTFRHHFARIVGTTPGEHRRTYARRAPGRCA